MSSLAYHSTPTPPPNNLTRTPGILVVDDEEMLVSLFEVVLRRQGFQVYTARSGQEALAQFLAHQEKIDLALLDVRMPGLDGPGTLLLLRQLRPTLRCCFMSGELGQTGMEELLSLGAERVFFKPFPLHRASSELWQLVCAGAS
jgi:DNA-binding response OmpR family regulator